MSGQDKSQKHAENRAIFLFFQARISQGVINLQCLLVTYHIANGDKALHQVLCYFDGEFRQEKKGCIIRTHMKNGFRVFFFFFCKLHGTDIQQFSIPKHTNVLFRNQTMSSLKAGPYLISPSSQHSPICTQERLVY